MSAEPTSPLLVERCEACARWAHPATGECPDCGAPLVVRPVSGQGIVFTFTVNYHPYNPDIPTPYVIALVELDEQRGLRVAANIVDCEPDAVRCGMPVVLRGDRGGGGAPLFAPATR
ncbi:putative nucleic-acid-binding protein containing a Zn-ribbon [Mycobacterium basiliense]|uniref:Putative nucleic-acid-binding protein containing a Zn-ribbon n=1 Tax=Mycobacterium basiliense TaxID=2094119 RepID=A0A3S4FLE9_9MYCO|nr:OB-fold domain-containing protein [Mycobacterium basiliense]VDM87880.1 putative nucleic-acid-binding protein containing a Zn-ribbon [Mycobacterium basiliense]